MTAAQHAIVWNNVADRLKRTAQAAAVEANRATEISFMQLSIFAATIASAYQDTATVFKLE